MSSDEEREAARAAFLARVKAEGLAFLDAGDLANAYTSVSSSLSQHPDFRAVADKMNGIGVMYLMQRDKGRLRSWIEGFR